jgi:hypothetical protein
MKDIQIHSELKELLKERSKTCVSLIIPLPKIAGFERTDHAVIDKAIDKLNILLGGEFKPELVKEFTDRLHELKGKIAIEAGMEGLGIFISPKLLKVVQFPFPVKEKMLAADSFEVRDVMFKEFGIPEYFVLKLTNNQVHLLKAKGNEMEEIHNLDFPMGFTDDYEYNKPSIASSDSYSRKNPERDKSNMKEIRAEAFYHELDKKLRKYLDEDTPLMIAGVKKDIGYFEKETENKSRIAGKVEGSFDGYNSEELKTDAWRQMQAYSLKRERKMVSDLKELFGRELVSIGIKNVWRDARLGKGNILVVEKDFSKPAFLGDDEYRLLLRPPVGDHKIVNDAVDDIIETVMQKDGRVVFVHNDVLREFEGIALVKRYT